MRLRHERSGDSPGSTGPGLQDQFKAIKSGKAVSALYPGLIAVVAGVAALSWVSRESKMAAPVAATALPEPQLEAPEITPEPFLALPLVVEPPRAAAGDSMASAAVPSLHLRERREDLELSAQRARSAARRFEEAPTRAIAPPAQVAELKKAVYQPAPNFFELPDYRPRPGFGVHAEPVAARAEAAPLPALKNPPRLPSAAPSLPASAGVGAQVDHYLYAPRPDPELEEALGRWKLESYTVAVTTTSGAAIYHVYDVREPDTSVQKMRLEEVLRTTKRIRNCTWGEGEAAPAVYSEYQNRVPTGLGTEVVEYWRYGPFHVEDVKPNSPSDETIVRARLALSMPMKTCIGCGTGK